MRVRTRAAWILLLAIGLAGCQAYRRPVLVVDECEKPPDCTDITGNAVIAIDADGHAHPPCAIVEKERNVVWVGAEKAEVKSLDIQFKVQNGIQNPARPLCSGPFCWLSPIDMPKEPSGKEQAYCYAVDVTAKDGRKIVDPKLIIKY